MKDDIDETHELDSLKQNEDDQETKIKGIKC